MNLLLDTHILLWAITGADAMPAKGKRLVTDSAVRLHVSAASIWEVAIKHGAGGEIPMSGSELIEEIEPLDVEFLPIEPLHGARAGELPRHHSDPFDRMLVAQAMIDEMKLLTHDKKLTAYGDFVVLV